MIRKRGSERKEQWNHQATANNCRLFQLPHPLMFGILSRLPIHDLVHCSACNGLLCLLGPKKVDPFHVCNPILGEFITIQPPYKERCRSCFWGLGYSTVTNQYKLLQSYYPTVESNYPMAEIYTIGSGTWRSIGNAPTDLVSLPFNAFLNGALNWYNISFGGAGEFINSFDIDTERFGIVPPPDHFQELDKVFTEYTTTGVQGDCLFMCYFPDFVQFDIWVMKEYGVKESWTKQFVIKDKYPNGYGWDIYQPMLVLSNGEIFMLLNNEEITG
ncbi:hypothetical protein J1N35_037304 [Gossypium stocksii]|uniref:F-box associated beta-propeller type 1 domain-containing protein n=1 Tax=Gossypium stocksii TaxID=47602 RepID=A0A9D3ZLR0_9ROSI|nr:hypothetical protein J1N35_037304 [Gossypium stocksii]